MASLASSRSGPRKENMLQRQYLIIFCLLLLSILLVVAIFSKCSLSQETLKLATDSHDGWMLFQARSANDDEFDCFHASQGAPVFANKMEGMHYPFFVSIADLGSPEKPNRNFQRMIKGKLFQKAKISQTIQFLLEKINSGGYATDNSVIIDVGANIGFASFAATSMGFKVLAFEPVFENLQKLCDGMYLNRAGHLLKLYHAAVSDMLGNITIHKVIGRLDNTAVSLSGAKLAFHSNEVVPYTVRTITLDAMVSQHTHVPLIKVDVQGWEFHVLKGAENILRRPTGKAPYLIYEDDEKLLKESNTTSQDILMFLEMTGYKFCKRIGGDRHCSKDSSLLVKESML